MPYQVIVPTRVQHEVGSLLATVGTRVIRALERLKDGPRPSGCFKLVRHREEYRIRMGEYRVRYEVRDADQRVFMLACQHRQNVYRP